MENRTTIYEWIQKFQKGGFDGEDKEAQTRAGWYDWFCKKESLAGKTKVLGKKLIQIVFSEKFNINKTYVFFKNNCPMRGIDPTGKFQI